eukprot:11591800-Alexandrium_andersonii.AAC.1
MASPSLLQGQWRWSSWLSPGQQGSPCAASAWRTYSGGPVARAHARSTERQLLDPPPKLSALGHCDRGCDRDACDQRPGNT